VNSLNEITTTINYSTDLDKFIQFAFDDLVEVAADNHRLFEELYYNRKSQCDEFYALMENCHKNAPNVLIIGGAGVGKTSFMYKLKIACDPARIHPIMIDYRKVVPKTTDGLMASLIKQLEVYFDAIERPIHTLNKSSSIDQQVQQAYDHLDSIPKTEVKKHLVLFLDDFDYAEDDWYDLLKYFLPFSNNEKTSLVLSVRPPLLNAIDEYDERFRNSYIKKARQMELAPISVENVISTRLAPVLLEKEATNKLYGIISALFKRESAFCALARRYGTVVDNLPRFEYPLSKKHNTFMQRITSGDLRETFDIAYESLKYIIKNEHQLETKIEDGLQKKIIGREGVMKLLYDNTDSAYRIINLHNFRAPQTRNSLFYNVLQGIAMHGVADDTFYARLAEMGHKKNRVNQALAELSSRRHRFFVPSRITPKKVKRHIEYDREYAPTPKLSMYLEMSDEWDEYKSRCGEPGEAYES
jgi:hypothetical protein